LAWGGPEHDCCWGESGGQGEQDAQPRDGGVLGDGDADIRYRWLEDELARDPTARMKRPIVPEQPVLVVPEDGLRLDNATDASVVRSSSSSRNARRNDHGAVGCYNCL
jgi:hypothetical protein